MCIQNVLQKNFSLDLISFYSIIFLVLIVAYFDEPHINILSPICKALVLEHSSNQKSVLYDLVLYFYFQLKFITFRFLLLSNKLFLITCK